MTQQRKLIYEVVRASDKHMTAEEIFLQAKERLPSLSIATVYRNLGLMARDGEIRRITAAGADRYDRSVSEHDHLICVKCGRMSDAALDGLRESLAQQSGQQILSYELNMYYICPDCMEGTDKGD